MLKTLATAAAAAAMLSLAACDGSAEKAGENMDSAIEEATQGEENLGDGALEQAGESIDEATGNQQNQDAADAGDERQFLEDADDAGGIRRRRVGEDDLPAVQHHAALVRLDHARHDLHEGGLAGAILAEHAVDAAGFDGQIGLGQRVDAAIALGNAFHAEQRGGGGCVHHASQVMRKTNRRRGEVPQRRRDLSTADSQRGYSFASDWPMISWAVKLMPQVGKALPTKKLSPSLP